jgi:hypothetical protein
MSVVSIHQPELFPYIGYFVKIYQSDIFVILDNVDFKKNNFQNRNTITLLNDEKTWLSFPVNKVKSGKLISETFINIDVWLKIKRTVIQNYSKSPYYSDLHELIQYVDLNLDTNLSLLNGKIIRFCLKKLNFKTRVFNQSEIPVSGKKSELLLNICNYFEAQVYLSGSGGKDYLEENIFEENGILLQYLTWEYEPIYHFKSGSVLLNPSVIDIVGNCGWKGFSDLFNEKGATT